LTLLALAVAGRGVVDPAEPVFFADDEAVVRGTAAFETIRVRRGRAVLLDKHVERLERSSLALRLPPPDGARQLAMQAAEAAGADEAALRLFRTSATLVATAAPLPPSSAASASSRSIRRAPRTTAAPARVSSRAVAAPMPLDAPVTTALRPTSAPDTRRLVSPLDVPRQSV